MDDEKNLKKSILSGLFWKFSERFAAQIISMIVSIVLARILLPSEYGAIALVTIFITIADVFVNDGFGTALIQKQNADNLDFSTVFYFGIFFSIILYIILFFSSDFVAAFYDLPILSPVLRVLSLRIPIGAINSVQQAYVSRNMMFKRFFYSTIGGTIASAFIGIIMAYLGFGVWALVFQYLSNTIVGTIVLWYTVRWRPDKAFSLARLKSLFKYGWKLLVQSLMINIYSNLRSLVIGKVYTADDLAFYNRGSYFPNLIVVNVDAAMGAALFPAMAKKQTAPSQIKNITKKAVQLSSYVMSPLLIGFAACSVSFVEVILTEKWLPMVPYLIIICFNLLFRPAQSSALQAIKSVGRSDLALKMDIPIRIFGVASLLLVIKWGVIYIAFTEVLVGLFGLLLYGYFCGQTIGYGVKEIVLDFGQSVILALIMGGFVYGIEFLNISSSLVTLIVQILVGASVYIFLSIIVKNKNFMYIWDEIIGLLRSRNKSYDIAD